jgi:hypothetical protein
MPPPHSSLAEVVANPALARLVDDLRVALARLHSDVRVMETSMELRAEFHGVAICRVVPYRELLHIQVGEDPMWEARVRKANEFPQVMDRVVRAFLRAHGAEADSGTSTPLSASTTRTKSPLR